MTASRNKTIAALARLGVTPRGFSREEAAAYIGIGPVKFDELVAAGRMPPAKRIGSRRVWDRTKLDDAFDRLPDDGDDGEAEDVWSRARA